jgi:hypothetical protein
LVLIGEGLLQKRKLIDIGLCGFIEYWKTKFKDGNLDIGWFVEVANPRQSTSETKIYVHKNVNKSINARF